MEYITAENAEQVLKDYTGDVRCDEEFHGYLADRINFHLSELQVGNRERAIEKMHSVETLHHFTREGIVDMVLSVVVPGSEEVERLKADLIDLEKISDARCDALVHLNLHAEKLQAELAALRAAMPKWKVGDTFYVLNGDVCVILKMTIACVCENGVRADGRFWGFHRIHATEAECRASIPVEHLKGES